MNWLELMQNAVSEQKKLFDTVKSEGRTFTDEEKVSFEELTNKVTKARSMVEFENKLAADQKLIDDSKVIVNNDGGVSNVIVKKNEPLFRDREELFSNIATTLKSGTNTPKILNAIEGANTVVPEEGGLTVDSELMDGIDKIMWENSVIAPRCKQIKVGAKFNGISRNRLIEDSRVDGSRYGGATVTWLGEGDSITKSNPEIENYETKLKKAAAVVYMTEELMQDSAAMVSTIESVYPEEMAYKVDEALISGDGTSRPLGAYAVGGPSVTIAKVTSQTAKTIVYENLQAMYLRLWTKSRKTAVWLVSQDAEGQLWDLEHPGDSSPLVKQSGREGKMNEFTIFGIPIKVIEQAETLGSKGDIRLADYAQYELLTKKGIRAQSSIHVAFLTDQTALRFIKRVGGAPKWKSAKTPAKGSSTISTHLDLAVRA